MRQLGKATFLKFVFENASFITSGNPPGTLDLERQYKVGYLFIHLVWTVYFKRVATAFEVPSPLAHFLLSNVTGDSILQQVSQVARQYTPNNMGMHNV